MTAVGVTLVTDAPTVAPVETEAAVGDLAAGEMVVFALPIEVTENAAAGTRQLAYRVAYTDDDGDRRRSDRLTTDVRVAPARDAVVVKPASPAVTAGDSGVVELTVTNNRGVTITDVQAKAFADDPLSIDDDQAFVASLAPGESATIQFTVSAAGGASEKAYRMSVDFLYTLPDGDSELSDPVNVGVRVEQPPPQQLPDWLVPVLVGFVILIAAALLLRRRLGGRTTPAPREDVPPAAGDGGVDTPGPLSVEDGGVDEDPESAAAEVDAPKEPDWFVGDGDAAGDDGGSTDRDEGGGGDGSGGGGASAGR
ncbi:COG1361 S-layer family protein [Halobaculum litoreum]|uniref:COG1361 S-layer family protein n=1 Tax=Halobaculum litoreum TaxID=3031998 RepID=A0ABD5XSF0_9EURY|nr:hypothetical protein [Halobaculum sp. DT92]